MKFEWQEKKGVAEVAEKWLPLAGINAPCADISFSWKGKHQKGLSLSVRMYFSWVTDGIENDLEMTFKQPLAIRWEDELPGIIFSLNGLPKCPDGQFSQWTHPTLIIRDSSWAKTYADSMYSKSCPEYGKITHYFLVSMNDLVHVLCESEPVVQWVPGEDD
jgi:hypothetical protein